jgi:hypothetical protein
MENEKLSPEKITKPIQLLAAWLAGLLTIDSAFLLAASKMDLSSWQSGALTIAAILNVPLFIGALFMLQTKFRPELQEDSYYSTYLNNRTNQPIKVTRGEVIIGELEKKVDAIEKFTHESKQTEIFDSTLSALTFGINIHLSNKKEIFSELRSKGVIGFTEFGEGIDPPKVLKVAVSESIPKNDLTEILSMSQRLGFTHYGFIEHFEEIAEDVLFGAYADTNLRIVPA